MTLAKATGLDEEDAEDVIRELAADGFLIIDEFLEESSSNYSISTKPSLFVEFDCHFMGWNAERDAVQIATDMMNDEKFTTNPEEMAKIYGWSFRRLNPALKYLVDGGTIHDMFEYGIQPLLISSVEETRSLAIRRFSREHQT